MFDSEGITGMLSVKTEKKTYYKKPKVEFYKRIVTERWETKVYFSRNLQYEATKRRSMENGSNIESKVNNLVGIIPIAGNDDFDFEQPWPNCMMPIGPSYSLLEASIVEVRICRL